VPLIPGVTLGGSLRAALRSGAEHVREVRTQCGDTTVHSARQGSFRSRLSTCAGLWRFPRGPKRDVATASFRQRCSLSYVRLSGISGAGRLSAGQPCPDGQLGSERSRHRPRRSEHAALCARRTVRTSYGSRRRPHRRSRFRLVNAQIIPGHRRSAAPIALPGGMGTEYGGADWRRPVRLCHHQHAPSRLIEGASGGFA
jgi:hypothetical protein